MIVRITLYALLMSPIGGLTLADSQEALVFSCNASSSRCTHSQSEYGQYLNLRSQNFKTKVSIETVQQSGDRVIRSVLQELKPILGDTSQLDLRYTRFIEGETGYSIIFTQYFGEAEAGENGSISFKASDGSVSLINTMLSNPEQPNLDTAHWLPITTIRLIGTTVLEGALGGPLPNFEECEEQHILVGRKRKLYSKKCGYDYGESLRLQRYDDSKIIPFYEIWTGRFRVEINALDGTFSKGYTSRDGPEPPF